MKYRFPTNTDASAFLDLIKKSCVWVLKSPGAIDRGSVSNLYDPLMFSVRLSRLCVEYFSGIKATCIWK